MGRRFVFRVAFTISGKEVIRNCLSVVSIALVLAVSNFFFCSVFTQAPSTGCSIGNEVSSSEVCQK